MNNASADSHFSSDYGILAVVHSFVGRYVDCHRSDDVKKPTSDATHELQDVIMW